MEWDKYKRFASSRISSLPVAVGSGSLGSTSESLSSQTPLSSTKYEVVHQRDCPIREGGCRLHCYSSLLESLAISIQNNGSNSIFGDSNYGVRKYPLSGTNKSEVIYIHRSTIKDMVMNQYDATVLTTSLDKTLKITSLISKNVIATIHLEKAAWSVQQSPTNKDYIYAGSQCGSVMIYDKRRYDRPVSVLSSSSQSPVVSLSHVEFEHGMVLGGGNRELIQLTTCPLHRFT